MAAWIVDDIPWGRFDRSRLDREIVPIVKAASLVELNGAAYARHLCRMFDDDPGFQEAARRWGEEETRHGLALGRWAELADSKFDFAAAFARFQAGYQVDFDRDSSRRGSRSGEMIARCIVETGTSSYYTALREAAGEPVLQEICRRIAADEIRYYKLFHRNLVRCLERERIGFWRRLRIAFGRIAEARDDELAYAYYAADNTALRYDRRRCSRAYANGAYRICRRHHVERAVALTFNTVGLAPKGRLARATSRLAWAALHYRATRLAKAAV